MLGIFKPKPAQELRQVETPKPASTGTVLRERMDEAKRELGKINKLVNDNTVVRTKLEADLFASRERTAALTDAIAIGQSQLNSGNGNSQLRVNLEKARAELSRLNMEQIPLEAQIATLDRFLEKIDIQKQELEESVTRLDGRLTELEIREIGANISQTVGDVEENITDYRREVYTKEAYRELASGI